jgi:sarcosine oxidase subunit alpha
LPAGANADGVTLIGAGGHLFAEGAAPTRGNAEGHVTSACYSPTLGQPLALGVLLNGRARHGETIRYTDHLRQTDTPVVITDPVAFDPDGGRARG